MKSRILPIAGDASFRTFYRLIQKKDRKIIVFAKKEKYKNLIAYSAINKFLRINKILAPKLYSHNYERFLFNEISDHCRSWCWYRYITTFLHQDFYYDIIRL